MNHNTGLDIENMSGSFLFVAHNWWLFEAYELRINNNFMC